MELIHLQVLLAAGIGLWILISTVIARVSGWAALARIYRLQDSFDGRRWHFQTAQMRWATNYGSCLTLGVSPRGLYLAVPFLFRPTHPPLLVPWGDIAVDLRQLTWFTAVEFRFRRVPGIPLRISPGLASRLAAAAGRWWPSQRFTDGRA
jgi:hypothetical protein